MEAKLTEYRQGSSRVVAISRPEVRNALDWETWSELSRILADVRADDTSRSLILTGEGNCFSAGGDVRSMGPHGSGLRASVARLELAQSVIVQLWKFPKPVIAAVEGFAVGVGWTLALASDLIVADEEAFFAAVFAKRALVPDGGLAWMLGRSLAHSTAAEIIYSGRRVFALEALEMGLVHEVVPSGESIDRAKRLAAGLDELSLDATAGAKDLLRSAGNLGFEDFLDYERNVVALTFSGPDAQEGRDAFLRKRQPEYNKHILQ